MEQIVENIQSWLPVISFFLPLVIGLFLKVDAPDRLKAVVMLLFTAVAALANQVDANAGILTREMLEAWGSSTLITVMSYLGVWKPLGVGNVKPEFGVG